jgi:Tol biopolymer transport system component/DNA-binding winged helix-turn-helix (wHTH) protein
MVTLPHHKYKINQCIVNCHDMSITVDEKSVTLPAKVFEFLKLLILHSATTVTKEQAIEAIWLGNIEVGKRGAGNAIWHLRKSFTELGIDPEDILKTITKVGYQLITTPIVISEFPQATEKVSSSFKSKYILYASLCALFFIGLILFIFINKENSPVVTLQAKNNAVEPLKITNFEGVEEQTVISPDGQYMAFRWRRNQKKSQIFIKEINISNSPLRQVSVTDDHDVSPSWSADSQSLAYFRIDEKGGCSLHIRELIGNSDQLIAEDCTSSGFLQGLDWSPDGKKIAYAKKMPDRVAVFVYNIADKTFKPHSFPNAGEKDLVMKWAVDSRKLLVVRTTGLNASIYSIDETHQEQVLVESENTVIGLTWDHTNNAFYFNSMKEGTFVISKFDVKSNAIEEFYRGSGLGAIALNEQLRLLFFSKHVVQEHIAIHSLENGKLIKQLASSSRDLYGQFVAKSKAMLFLSNRSGAWELWLKDGNTSKQLTDNQGQVTIPAASPIENSFVVAIKKNKAEKFVMYQGILPEGIQKQLFEIPGDVRNPSYSIDGKSLYFSSNADGDWGLYRYSFITRSIELITAEHGQFAVESPDGGIYFSKENVDGIFYLSKDKMKSHRVTQDLNKKDWGSFFYLNDALHYLKRDNEFDKLIRIDKVGVEHDVMTFPIFSIRNYRAFSPIENNKIAVTMQGISGADIYSIPLQ